jgi:hypothetical protein
MNHPQMTAMIAAQHGRDLQRSAHRARQVKQAPHGVRVVRVASSAPAAMPAPRPTWSTRIASAFGRTATVTPPAKPKLA